MKYAKYEKLDTKLEDKLQKNNECMYKKRDYKLYSNKCIETQSDLKYVIDEKSMDKCKLLYNDRIETNVVSNKNNKQLNTRLIKTIPYRNPKIFDYNPEQELMVQSGLYTGNRKSTSNTGEIKQDLPPMIKSLKEKIKHKSTNFDISRFQLSSRNLKGNKYYMKKYKKNLDLIKSSLN